MLIYKFTDFHFFTARNSVHNTHYKNFHLTLNALLHRLVIQQHPVRLGGVNPQLIPRRLLLGNWGHAAKPQLCRLQQKLLSSESFCGLKTHKCRLWLGLRLGPNWESLQCSPEPIVGGKGLATPYINHPGFKLRLCFDPGCLNLAKLFLAISNTRAYTVAVFQSWSFYY